MRSKPKGTIMKRKKKENPNRTPMSVHNDEDGSSQSGLDAMRPSSAQFLGNRKDEKGGEHYVY